MLNETYETPSLAVFLARRIASTRSLKRIDVWARDHVALDRMEGLMEIKLL